MQIETFSFRFGEANGHMEWYRYNKEQGLWIDKFDGRMQAKRCRMTEAELEELEKIIRENKIDTWNGFCKLELCMCSGNSWTLHVTYAGNTECFIHAMGHSEAPEGFAEGKQALEAFFDRYLEE